MLSDQRLIENKTERTIQHIRRYGPRRLDQRDLNRGFQVLHRSLNHPDTWSCAHRLFQELSPKIEQSDIGYIVDWHRFLHRGIERSQSVKKTDAEAYLRLQRGHLLRSMGKYEQAETEYEKAATLYSDCKNELQRANALVYQARTLWRQGKASVTRLLLQHVWSILINEDLESELKIRVLAHYHFLQGVLFHTVEADLSSAERELRASLELWFKTEDEHQIALAESNLGPTLRDQGKHMEAISSYERSIATLNNYGDKKNARIYQLNLSNIYLDLEQPNKALTHLLAIEPVLRKSGNKQQWAKALTGIAIAYQMQNKLDDAIENFNCALDIYDSFNMEWSFVEVGYDVSIVYQVKGSYLQEWEILQKTKNTIEQSQNPPLSFELVEKIKNRLLELEEILKK
ncbi:MAG: tetratricopeptide repeat protein [Chloroflexota bacterium]